MQVSMESIHLLTHDDFKQLGIGLADGRLMIEKFRSKKTNRELAELVASVRATKKKEKKSETITTEFIWQHFNTELNKYTTVPIGKGGGTRREKLSKTITLGNILKRIKGIYFPGGINTHKGSIGLFKVELHGPDHTIIVDLDQTLGHFIERTAIKNCRLIFKTSVWNIIKDGVRPYDDESSDSDFEVSKRPKCSTPKNVRQVFRAKEVPPEPTLMDNSTVIFVNHINLGRVHRLFLSDSKMESVYNWVGSLSPTPELFELCYGLPGNLSVADTNDKVSSYENRCLTMRETSSSNFTIDIASGSRIRPLEPSTSTASQNYQVVRCPICSNFFPGSSIEQHASICADSKFCNIICDDESEDELPIILPFKETSPTTNIINFKDLVASLSIDLKNTISIKIRRGNSFNDFAEKIELPWIKKKRESNYSLRVTFIGEQGVDQGGVAREFFSGQ